MSSCVIRKEDQPVCQPWEISSFEVSSPSASRTDSAVKLPTIEQITAIQEQARQEGRAMGHAEGRAEGLAEGRQEAEIETARLHSLADNFAQELDKADETISQQVLDLAIEISRAMLKSAFTIRPELVIPVVKDAVRYLPALQQPAMLYLSPSDFEMVKNRIGDELTKLGWQLTDDVELESGGCRVETANNQIDASLPTRWQRVTAALGKDSDWLAT
jgi:flagellar assembly protein FliH